MRPFLLSAILVSAVGRCGLPAQDQAQKAEYSRVARLVAFPWIAAGQIQAGASDPLDTAISLFGSGITTPELSAARLAYIEVGIEQQIGYELGKGRDSISHADIADMAAAFRAGLTGRYDLAVGPLLRAMLGGAWADLQQRVGRERFGRGIELQSRLWSTHMVPVASRLAGPGTDRLPVGVEVVRGTEQQTGLALVNSGPATLHDVTLRVASGLGAWKSGQVPPQYVFVSEWRKGQEVLLMPLLVEHVLAFRAASDFAPRVQVSLWCNELTVSDAVLELPTKDYASLCNRRPASFRLRLRGSTGGTEAPAAPASGPGVGQPAGASPAADPSSANADAEVLNDLHQKLRVARMAGEQRTSVRLLQQLVKLDPNQPIYALWLGESLGSLGPEAAPERSRAELRRAIARAEQADDAMAARSAAAVSAVGARTPGNMQQLRQVAERHLQALEAAKADKLLLVSPDQATLRTQTRALEQQCEREREKVDQLETGIKDANQRLARAKKELADAERQRKNGRVFKDLTELKARISDLNAAIKDLTQRVASARVQRDALVQKFGRYRERLDAFSQ